MRCRPSFLKSGAETGDTRRAVPKKFRGISRHGPDDPTAARSPSRPSAIPRSRFLDHAHRRRSAGVHLATGASARRHRLLASEHSSDPADDSSKSHPDSGANPFRSAKQVLFAGSRYRHGSSNRVPKDDSGARLVLLQRSDRKHARRGRAGRALARSCARFRADERHNRRRQVHPGVRGDDALQLSRLARYLRASRKPERQPPATPHRKVPVPRRLDQSRYQHARNPDRRSLRPRHSADEPLAEQDRGHGAPVHQ